MPTFVVGGLDDIFQRGEPLLYERLAKRVDARLLIGPWTHIAAGNGLPRDGVPSVDALRLQWFDQHVRGVDARTRCIPKVTQFVRGVDRYQSSTSWPVPGLAAGRWYLRGDGSLTTTKGTATEAGRRYVQAPVTGACTRSTAQWLIGAVDQSPCATDNRLDEAANLTYTSAPVTAPTTINGPIQADVWVSTTGADASVSVAVSDVAPDGSSRGLTNGLLLASRRAVDPHRSRMLDGQSIQPWHPFTRASIRPVPAGQPLLLPIEVFPTSATLLPGHRLRITISPYDVPHALPPAPALLSSLGGIVTGCLVGIARVAGETAPLLFTALGNLNFTTNVTQPMQTLSLQIYVYATGPFDEWHRLAWAAALVLMGLVLVLGVVARWVTRQRYGRVR